MVIIKAELHSPTGEITDLGRLIITNDGSGTVSVGNYEVALRKAVTDVQYREARVLNFPRKTQGVWRLLHRSLDALFSSKAKE